MARMKELLSSQQLAVKVVADKYQLGVTYDGMSDAVILEVPHELVDKVEVELTHVYGVAHDIDETARCTEFSLPFIPYDDRMNREMGKHQKLFGGANEWVAHVTFLNTKQAELAVNQKQLQEKGNIEDVVFATFPKETIYSIEVNDVIVYKNYSSIPAFIRNNI